MGSVLTKEQKADLGERAWDLRRRGRSMHAIARELGISSQTVHAMLKATAKAAQARMAQTIEAMKIEQTEQLDYIANEAMLAWERSQNPAELTRTTTKELGAKREVEESDEPQAHGGALKRKRVVVPSEEAGVEVTGQYLNHENGEETTEEERAALLAAKADATGVKDPLTIVERNTVEESRGQTGDPRFLAEARAALDAKREIWGLNAPKQDANIQAVIVKVYAGVNVVEEV